MAEWSSSYVTSLPDSAFACPDSRKYPHHNKAGEVDKPHLRAALSRVGDASNDQCGKAHLQRHARALGMGAAKAASEYRDVPFQLIDDDAFAILAIPWGGPMEKAGAPYGVDLDGDWFSPSTDIKPDWFDQRPVLWHHGKDPTGVMGTERLGKATNLRMEDDGWWVDFWWEKGQKREALVKQLAKKGAHIYGSSQTIPALTKIKSTGEIEVWPYMEQTLSTTPQNTYSHIRPMKAVLDDFELSGIAVSSALKALLPAIDELSSDLVATEGIEPLLPQAMSERDLRKLERLVDQLLDQVRRKPTPT